MKSFKGLNGTIILRDSGVAIVRENMLGTTFHNGGEVEIPYSNVSEVEVVPGALLIDSSVLSKMVMVVHPMYSLQ